MADAAHRIAAAVRVRAVREHVAVFVFAVPAVELEEDAETALGRRGTTRIVTVDEAIAVVVRTVGTRILDGFRRHAHLTERATRAVRVVAIEEVVAVVVLTITTASFPTLVRNAPSAFFEASEVVAVDETVAVFVTAVEARDFAVCHRRAHVTDRIPGTGGVSAVDETIAVVVEPVATSFFKGRARLAHLTFWRTGAVWVSAVDDPVAVIILPVTALKLTARDWYTLETFGIHQAVIAVRTIEESVTVVVHAVAAALLERRRRLAYEAERGPYAWTIITIDEAVAVVVHTVVAYFASTRRDALAAGDSGVLTETAALNADIVRALVTVVAVHGSTGQAAARRTQLPAVAEEAVVTETVVRRDVASTDAFGALVDGALDAVIADEWLAAGTDASAAAFTPVADEAIVALGVAAASLFSAPALHITHQPTGAQGRVRDELASAHSFDASVRGTAHVVIAGDGGARPTQPSHAALGAVAEQAVIAVHGRIAFGEPTIRYIKHDAVWNRRVG